MSEEELEEVLDEIFEEDIEMIRERMKVLIRGYDKALTKLVEKDKVIDLMAKHLSDNITVVEITPEEYKYYFYKKAEEEND